MKSVFQIDFLRYFLLTRPYSWFSISFVAILASIFVNNKILLPELFFDILFGILIWVSCNLFAEKFSKDMLERGKIFLPIPIFIFALAVIIAMFRNVFVLFFLVIILISSIIYSKKNKYSFIGKISFFIRGFMELNLFLAILFFYNFNFNNFQWVYLLFWVYFITCGRNLIGDLRDLKFDKKTLPTVIGIKWSKFFVIVLYLFPLIVSQQIVLSCVAAIVLILFLNDFYVLHKLLVLIHLFIFFELIVLIVAESLFFIVGCLLLGILMTFLYDLVPRQSNPFNKIN